MFKFFLFFKKKIQKLCNGLINYFGLVLSALLLSSCATNNSGFNLAEKLSSSYGLLFDDYDMKKDELPQLSYSTLLVELSNGSDFSMALGYLNADGQQWFSRDLFSILTNNGRVVQAYKMGEEVYSLHLTESNIDLFNIEYQQDSELVKRIDLPAKKRFSLPVYLKVEANSFEERQLWKTPVKLLRIEEHVSIPSLNFEHTNIYWKDPKTNFIWESVQQWTPGSDVIHYKVLKPWLGVAYP